MDYIKLRSFCTEKEITDRAKGQHIKWRKNFPVYSSGKGLLFIIHKELKNSITKKPNNAIKEQANELSRHFSEVVQIQERASISPTIREIQSKPP